jgi:hypothetical protein
MSIVPKCSICGTTFARRKELDGHIMEAHNLAEEESLLLRKALDEKARKRSRGPYRKAHAA